VDQLDGSVDVDGCCQDDEHVRGARCDGNELVGGIGDRRRADCHDRRQLQRLVHVTAPVSRTAALSPLNPPPD